MSNNAVRYLWIAGAVLFFASMASITHAAAGDVTVILGGTTVPFIVTPYVGHDGQVFVPVDIVHLMGGEYAPLPGGKTVKITGSSGATVESPCEIVKSRYCVPIQKYADTLGATVSWDAPKRTLTLSAKLGAVREDVGVLSIITSYPIHYKVNTLDNPNRIYVDIYGLDVTGSPATITSSDPQVSQIRIGRIDDATARVVMDLKKPLGFHVNSPDFTNKIDVGLNEPVLSTATSADKSNPTINDISYHVVSPDLTQITVKTSSTAHYDSTNLDDPPRLVFNFTDTAFTDQIAATIPMDSPLATAIHTSVIDTDGSKSAYLAIDLAGPVESSVDTQDNAADGVVYTINLRTPRTTPAAPTATSFQGLKIMIDPGHGAEDSGALSGDYRFSEKDFTLAIGKKLRDVFIKYGAVVYMTRQGDTRPPVDIRPVMAIQAGANYFISIHLDSFGKKHTWTAHHGTTVYYHGNNPTTHRLATDIVNRIVAVSGLTANGAKTDYIRFPGWGDGVLRGLPQQKIPGVLIECGYVNNQDDLAKLQDPVVQQRIVEAIAAGLLDFINEKSHKQP